MRQKIISTILLHLIVGFTFAQNGVLKGTIKSKTTQETLPCATVKIVGTSQGVTANLDGEYVFPLPEGKYEINISYVSFQPQTIRDVNIKRGQTTELNIDLEATALQNVVIRGTNVKNTDAGMIQTVKASDGVSSGISAQQISQSQDRNAAEVIRRVSGVVVNDNRFINVRGLSQRYNNVYLNNAPTPGSETDIRAFSFDVLPGSQIDNLMVVKSPMAHLPADFSGGFVQIATKNTAEKNTLTLSYSMGYRVGTSFSRQETYRGSPTDWLGFDNGTRKIPVRFPLKYNTLDDPQRTHYTQLLNNNWQLGQTILLPDQRFSVVGTAHWKIKKTKISNFTALNYSNSSQAQDMFNARYYIYDDVGDSSVFHKKYNDEVYTNDSRLSGLCNWSWISEKGGRFEWSNFFNQSGRKRTTVRSGHDYGNDYQVQERELYYNSRTTYSGQFNTEHRLGGNQKLNCNVSYSFAAKHEPDRKIVVSRKNMSEHSLYYGQYATGGNDIRRNFQQLREHIAYTNAHYEIKLNIKNFKPILSVGTSFEYRTRDFNARNFTYDYGDNRLLDPAYIYLPYAEILSPRYMHDGGTTLDEKTNKSDSYDVTQILPAAYFSLKLPFLKKLEAYLGLRYESNTLMMNGYESDGVRPVNIRRTEGDFFPSASLVYRINAKHLLRTSYGYAINRPEFRELAPYVYYDFDLFANFEGNPNLENAYIHNADLRYEFYPSAGEVISAGVFYKSFQNPIEVTYFYTGGQLQYSFANARSADNIGVEVELRKNLGFMGMKDFSFVANASYISSQVHFRPDELVQKRAMQGQSPFLVNLALFFRKPEWGLHASLQYNIVGRRIVVLGEANQDPTQCIPDTYEMPRNVLDFTLSKRVGKYVEINFGIKDMIGQRVIFKQFPTFENNGQTYSRQQTTRSYKPGQVITVGVIVKMEK